MTTIGEIAASAESARWNAYSAWAQMRADQSTLMTDMATHASPAVISADRAELASSQQQFSHHRAARIDVIV